MRTSILFLAGTPMPAPKILYEKGSLRFTETMLSALVTVAVILIFAAVVRIFFIPRWRKKESFGAFRMMIEGLVSVFDKEALDKNERYGGFTGAWYFGCSFYICVGILMDLVGLRPPISSLAQTLTLGFTTFVIIHMLGFFKKKHKRLLHYLNPISLITDIVVPFSMALRLFGAVYSGYLVMHLVYSLPWWKVVGLSQVASVMFTLFHALIQSYVFMLLSMSFVQEAIEVHPKTKKEKRERKKEKALS